jgi:hypothetical protein
MSRPRVLGVGSSSATRTTDILRSTPVECGDTPTVCRDVRAAGSRPTARAADRPRDRPRRRQHPTPGLHPTSGRRARACTDAETQGFMTSMRP